MELLINFTRKGLLDPEKDKLCCSFASGVRRELASSTGKPKDLSKWPHQLAVMFNATQALRDRSVVTVKVNSIAVDGMVCNLEYDDINFGRNSVDFFASCAPSREIDLQEYRYSDISSIEVCPTGVVRSPRGWIRQ